MSTEPQDKNTIRRNRGIFLIILLAIAGGIVWAIRADSDIIAAVTCFIGGLLFGIFGSDSEHPLNGIGSGLVAGAIILFLFMAVRFIVATYCI